MGSKWKFRNLDVSDDWFPLFFYLIPVREIYLVVFFRSFLMLHFGRRAWKPALLQYQIRISVVPPYASRRALTVIIKGELLRQKLPADPPGIIWAGRINLSLPSWDYKRGYFPSGNLTDI